MNKQEKAEIEEIRLELHDMFSNDSRLWLVISRITTRLWQPSHKRDNASQQINAASTLGINKMPPEWDSLTAEEKKRVNGGR